MSIIVGSARHDENGKLVNGKAGDQTGKEVSTQTMYTHSKGWYIVRAKDVNHANKIAERMQSACNNNNIGYDQNQRLGIINHGIDTNTKTECDCSSLVRQCVKEATRKDPGNFTTINLINVLQKTGLFEKEIAYVNQTKTPVYNGDILVTKTKGHTVVVVSGNSRQNTTNIIQGTFYKGIDFSAVFDKVFYLKHHTDVANDSYYKNNPFEHFVNHGMKEGRQGNATFNVKNYKNRYQDLQEAFGNDLPKYYRHYIEFGKKENRIAI